MKRATVGLVAAVLAAGSVVTAAPAHAGPGDPVACIPSVDVPPPPTHTQTVVAVNGLDVTVNPNGSVPVELWAIYDYALDVASPVGYVWCVLGDTADPVFCPGQNTNTGDLTNGRYVSQGEDGSVTVHGNELVAVLTCGL